MAFPTTALLAKAEFAFGADLTADPGTWTFTDVSSKLRTEDEVSVTYGRGNETGTADPSTCSCAFNDSDGALTPRNPGSTTPLQRNTPFRFSVHNGTTYVERFTGFASELKPKWLDSSQRVSVVQMQAADIYRRLSQGATPLKSAIFRCTTSDAVSTTVNNRIAYWPMEDKSGALQISPGLPTHGAMTFTGPITFANFETAGSDKILTLGDTAQLDVDVPFYTSTEHKTTTMWNVPADSAIGTGTVMQEIYVQGLGVNLVKVIWRGAGFMEIAAFNGAGVQMGTSGGVSYGQLEDEPFLTSCELTASGSNLQCRLFVRPIRPSSPVNGGFFDITITGARVDRVNHLTIAPAGFLKGVSCGHLTSLSAIAALSNADGINAAVYGYQDEMAADRLARLCREEGLTFDVASADDTSLMGPQTLDTIVDLFRQCEAADHGMLLSKNFGVYYIPRVLRYQATVALTLSGAGGYLSAIPEPTEDDSGIANDVTASRPNGASARYQHPSIDTDGRYNKGYDVNAPDDELVYHAEWLAHLGSPQDMRVPQLSVNFAHPTAVALFDDWLAAGAGSRVRVTSLPVARMPNGIDVFVEGATETYGPYMALVVMNCSPSRPSAEVFVIESAQYGRLDTGGSTLASSVTNSGTSLSVATSSNPVWTTTAAHSSDFPFDIEVINSGALSGERMTVTAITGASSPQTFTVTRGVNGISVAHSAGATVRLWRPGQIAL